MPVRSMTLDINHFYWTQHYPNTTMHYMAMPSGRAETATLWRLA